MINDFVMLMRDQNIVKLKIAAILGKRVFCSRDYKSRALMGNVIFVCEKIKHDFFSLPSG